MPDQPAARPLAVIDIDGVVADVRHRLHHLDHRPKNWPAFFAGAADDPPIPEGVARVTALAADHEVVYLTGRPERLRRVTEEWLERNGIGGHTLLMRGNRDFRPARRTKADEILRLAKRAPVALVLDDDPEVVRELRGAGWPVEMAVWVPHPKTLHEAQERDGRT